MEIKSFIKHAKLFRPQFEKSTSDYLLKKFKSIRELLCGSNMQSSRMMLSFIRFCQARAKADFSSLVSISHVDEIYELFFEAYGVNEKVTYPPPLSIPSKKRKIGKSAVMSNFLSLLKQQIESKSFSLTELRLLYSKVGSQTVRFEECFENLSNSGFILRNKDSTFKVLE